MYSQHQVYRIYICTYITYNKHDTAEDTSITRDGNYITTFAILTIYHRVNPQLCSTYSAVCRSVPGYRLLTTSVYILAVYALYTYLCIFFFLYTCVNAPSTLHIFVRCTNVFVIRLDSCRTRCPSEAKISEDSIF